jgi:hypothetical protein
MSFTWKRAVLSAVLLFLALFLIRFFMPDDVSRSYQEGLAGEVSQGSFENYASGKKASAPASTIGDAQKYEKIATLTETSSDFDGDKTRILELTQANKSVVQLERATGLKGNRLLHLGIGVPPDKFDAFVETAKGIGRNIQIEIVKNDKTNEYLQLRAKRTTLEKAREALEALKSSGGSIDERVNVQNRLMEIEEKIQELGVSLGEFDPKNELCTVKFTLSERAGPASTSMGRRARNAFEWAVWAYLMIGLGFLALVIGAWLAAGLAGYVRQLAAYGRKG